MDSGKRAVAKVSSSREVIQVQGCAVNDLIGERIMPELEVIRSRASALPAVRQPSA